MKHSVGLRVPVELYNVLKAIADREWSLTVTDLIIEAIGEYIENGCGGKLEAYGVEPIEKRAFSEEEVREIVESGEENYRKVEKLRAVLKGMGR